MAMGPEFYLKLKDDDGAWVTSPTFDILQDPVDCTIGASLMDIASPTFSYI